MAEAGQEPRRGPAGALCLALAAAGDPGGRLDPQRRLGDVGIHLYLYTHILIYIYINITHHKYVIYGNMYNII